MSAIYVFFNDFYDFLMASKGFGKVQASKWCKMQQNQWFSLVFKVSPSKMMEFQEFLLVLEGFGRKPGGNHKKSFKKHKFYIIYVFFNDF